VTVRAKISELQASTRAQEIVTANGAAPGAPRASAPRSGVDATTALHQAVSGKTWTWERSGRAPTQIVFETNGIMHNSSWGAGAMGDAFRWRISAPDTMTIENAELGTVKLVFATDLKSYKGADFKTGAPILGSPAGSGGDASAGSPTPKGGSRPNPFGKTE